MHLTILATLIQIRFQSIIHWQCLVIEDLEIVKLDPQERTKPVCRIEKY
jgi:hypothetical protein